MNSCKSNTCIVVISAHLWFFSHPPRRVLETLGKRPLLSDGAELAAEALGTPTASPGGHAPPRDAARCASLRRVSAQVAALSAAPDSGMCFACVRGSLAEVNPYLGWVSRRLGIRDLTQGRYVIMSLYGRAAQK